MRVMSRVRHGRISLFVLLTELPAQSIALRECFVEKRMNLSLQTDIERSEEPEMVHARREREL